MLKWLVRGGEGGMENTKVTDDPLATLDFKKSRRSQEIYSVNRINPLYEDGAEYLPGASTESGSGSDDLPETPPSRTASSSSGYGSNHPTMQTKGVEKTGPLTKTSIFPISEVFIESEKSVYNASNKVFNADKALRDASNKPVHVTKTLLNSRSELESCQALEEIVYDGDEYPMMEEMMYMGDGDLATKHPIMEGVSLTGDTVVPPPVWPPPPQTPPPVWPPHTLRINFDSKHVASQVQKLSESGQPKNKMRKNPNFVNSVMVGQSSRDFEQSSRGLGLSARPIGTSVDSGSGSDGVREETSSLKELGYNVTGQLGLASRDFGLSGNSMGRSGRSKFNRQIGHSSVRANSKIERSPARSSVPVTKTEHIQRNGVGRSQPVRRSHVVTSTKNLNIIRNSDYVNNIEVAQGGRSKRIPGMLQTRSSREPNQCFRIRYRGMSPIGEEGKREEGVETEEERLRRHDSIVTDSLLQMVSFSPADGSSGEEAGADTTDGGKDDMDKVIKELTQAVIKSRQVPQGNKVASKGRPAGRRSLRMKSGRRRAGSGRRSKSGIGSKAGSRTSTLSRMGQSKSGVDSMRDLWEKTGMRTNGRKLLMESEDEEEERLGKAQEGKGGVGKMGEGRSAMLARRALRGNVNYAYDSDSSQEEARRRRKPPPGSQSSSATYDSVSPPGGRSRPRLVRSGSEESGGRGWELEGGVARVNGMATVDLDAVHIEDDTDSVGSNKHVTFSNKTRNNQLNEKLVYDKVGVGGTTWAGRLVAKVGKGELSGSGNQRLWETYYGATQPVGRFKQIEQGQKRSDLSSWNKSERESRSMFGSDFTLDQVTSHLLTKKAKSRKRLKCYCKTFCFLLLVASFLLVIVAVSIFLSKGKHTFGPM